MPDLLALFFQPVLSLKFRPKLIDGLQAGFDIRIFSAYLNQGRFGKSYQINRRNRFDIRLARLFFVDRIQLANRVIGRQLMYAALKYGLVFVFQRLKTNLFHTAGNNKIE